MLWQLAFALLAVAVGQVMFSVAQTLALLRTEFNMNRKVQAAVWDRLLRLPASFYRDYNAGDLALRAQGVDSIRRLLAGVVMSSVLAGIFSFWYFALLFYYSLTLAVVATLLAVVAGAISVWATHYQIRYQRLILEYQGRLASFLLQVFIGINKLKISGTEDRAFREWAKRYSAKRQSELQAGEIKNNFAIFHAAFPTISSIALFWFVGSGQFMAEPGSAMGNPANAAASMLFPKLSVGTFLAFYAAYGAFIGSILGLVNAGLSALSVVPLWERAKPILSAECEVLSDGQMPDELTGQIEVSSLSFRYSEVLPYVLHDINLRIDSGDFVALVGASGSGKSTLFRLLVGLETPSSGGVYYDGMSLTHLDLREVRRQIGVVLQNTKIVGGTILTNIIGSKKLGAGDAWRAAKMAAIAKEIKRMPMGIHTIMMQDGASLSGGQRQRLLIARALVHNPRILFFDEATSALDNRTQALVSTSIERLHVTRIVVAHRLSTIRHADKIVVLDKGRIIEVGNFEELMSLNGIFASLAKRQLA
jgi:ATP-binding cassette subfamily C protein